LKYDFSNPRNIRKRSRALDRVLRYIPEYKPDKPDQEENFARVNIILFGASLLKLGTEVVFSLSEMLLTQFFPIRPDLKRVGAATEPWETSKEAYIGVSLLTKSQWR
jgi:hypothetical protein